MLVSARCTLSLTVALSITAPASVHGAVFLLVHIIGIEEEHGGIVLGQAMHVEVCLVVIGTLVAGGGIAVPAVEEARLDGQVEDHILAAIVLAGALAELRGLVVRLDALHRLGRQLADKSVAAEEALAVHGDADGFSVPCHAAVLSHLYTWQLLDEFVQPCSFLQVEGFRVEDDGVAADGEATGTSLHLQHFHQRLGGLQFDVTHIDGVLAVVGEAQHRLRLGIIAYHGSLQRAASAQVQVETA